MAMTPRRGSGGGTGGGAAAVGRGHGVGIGRGPGPGRRRPRGASGGSGSAGAGGGNHGHSHHNGAGEDDHDDDPVSAFARAVDSSRPEQWRERVDALDALSSAIADAAAAAAASSSTSSSSSTMLRSPPRGSPAAPRRSSSSVSAAAAAAILDPNNLRRLHPPLSTLLSDARSSVVRAACSALASLASLLTKRLRPLARDVLPDVVRLHAQTVRVMHAYATGCALALIRNVTCLHRKDVVFGLLVDGARGDKSKDVRGACVRYLREVLDSWPSGYLERDCEPIGRALARALSDPSQAVRSEARVAFVESFRRAYPDTWRKLVLPSPASAITDSRLRRQLLAAASAAVANPTTTAATGAMRNGNRSCGGGGGSPTGGGKRETSAAAARRAAAAASAARRGGRPAGDGPSPSPSPSPSPVSSSSNGGARGSAGRLRAAAKPTGTTPAATTTVIRNPFRAALAEAGDAPNGGEGGDAATASSRPIFTPAAAPQPQRSRVLSMARSWEESCGGGASGSSPEKKDRGGGGGVGFGYGRDDGAGDGVDGVGGNGSRLGVGDDQFESVQEEVRRGAAAAIQAVVRGVSARRLIVNMDDAAAAAGSGGRGTPTGEEAARMGANRRALLGRTASKMALRRRSVVEVLPLPPTPDRCSYSIASTADADESTTTCSLKSHGSGTHGRPTNDVYLHIDASQPSWSAGRRRAAAAGRSSPDDTGAGGVRSNGDAVPRPQAAMDKTPPTESSTEDEDDVTLLLLSPPPPAMIAAQPIVAHHNRALDRARRRKSSILLRERFRRSSAAAAAAASSASAPLTPPREADEHVQIGSDILRAHRRHVDAMMETLGEEMKVMDDFERRHPNATEDEVLSYFETVAVCLDQRSEIHDDLRNTMDRISRGQG